MRDDELDLASSKVRRGSPHSFIRPSLRGNVRASAEDNRDESDRLLRWKRVSLVVSLVVGLGLIGVLPNGLKLGAAFGSLAIALGLFFYLEIRRALIFRRDLREREDRR
jgi:hypothetical protein